MIFTNIFLYSSSLLILIVKAQRDWTKFGAPHDYASYVNDSSNLYQELFTTRNYKKELSPIYAMMPKNYNESDVPRFNVNTLLMYAKVIDLEAQTQLFKVCFELIFVYTDIRLAWEPKEFGGIEFFWVNEDLVWQPENGIGNAKALDLVYPQTTRAVKIFANGTIMMPNVYYAEINCAVLVGEFPFDEQQCSIPLMVFSYDRYLVSMTGDINADNPPSIAGNGEWEVREIFMQFELWGKTQFIFDVVTTRHSQIDLLNETGHGIVDVLEKWMDFLDFSVSVLPLQASLLSTIKLALSQLHFKFSLRRVPNFYVYVVAIPCFILTLLSICGMFWTPNYKEEQLVKLSIGLTSLISMTVLVDIIQASIPKTTKFPIIGIFVVISIIIISLSCVVVVVHMTKKKERKKPEKSVFAKSK